MRRTVIIPVVLHALAAVATLLWLLWYFIPTGNVFKGLATLLILLLAGWTVFKNYRREQPVSDTVVSATDLPLPDTQGPVVLVCGDMPDALFQRSPLRKTAQGWWLRIGDVSRLTDVVRNIQTQFPRQVGQLSVMYRCLPDHHQDEAVLRSALKTLRQQCKQIQSLTGFTLPVVLSAEFSGPETPWIIVRGDKPVVCPVNDSPQAFIDWQQAEDNILALPAVSEAFSFIRNTLADELEKPDRLTPPVRAFSVAMRLGVASPETQSVWSAWLCSRTCLQFSRKPAQSVPAGLFPDAVLPLLAPFASTVQGGQRTRRLVLLMWLCALTALGISALNNRDLIHHVGASLQRWNAIPMNHYRPKAESLAALKQDALLLERWQRQGEPLRYSLGYYPGQRLWLALQQAIDTWTPPPAPKPEPVPKIVRLDSMSLFDSGKSALKDGSTRILVNALVGIKARPGWLIVVSGHTDNTGSVQLNQTLSLQRAEAVRNWMRDTGDVPESCFAVQGYGDSRPIASNDTPDGRAHNRRVEISLVPQADACRLPGAKHASQDVRDVSTEEMEK
ncbi:OmpA family protein [Klebsiella michiganensis]|uniref:OmpA family protein n=1 Tax=Klebsiella michiganensis TaxID=1134687 RepID=UPI0006680E16|nr:OmpA family protein [Klebsiella michiganensis]MBW5963952.1 OmpA family protein [Klebsiella michiganensis]MBZ7625417.1 OmpA family protein [Klebsiella michiganensis]MCW9452049.1 OmpA family protein [Klebsiella michiganensis]MDU4798874.1 OmpA family protein [Klebsiella michiganensis]HBM2921256.1 OmpA family protein [Klebsiella michiganensis]